MPSLPTTALYHRLMARSLSSRGSTPSCSDDEDAITPVLELAPIAPAAPTPSPPERSQHSRRSSVTSDKASCRPSIEGIEDVDTACLWQRMLDMQRKFRCYNSARIIAAAENESVGAVVPSRACLDLLNDGISKMPEDIRAQVADYIREGDSGERRKKRRIMVF